MDQKYEEMDHKFEKSDQKLRFLKFFKKRKWIKNMRKGT